MLVNNLQKSIVINCAKGFEKERSAYGEVIAAQCGKDHYKILLSLGEVRLFVIKEEMTSSEIIHLSLSDDERWYVQTAMHQLQSWEEGFKSACTRLII